jgi:hypothetical protein
LALAPLSSNHSPELIDNLYLTGVYSTDSATTTAFLVYVYIPGATIDAIANIISVKLNEMQKAGAFNPTDDHTCTMTVHPLRDTHLTTYLDDERLIQMTTMMSPHMEGIPHAYIVKTPKISAVTYGLTLLACRQLH